MNSTFDLESYKRAQAKMIATNEQAYQRFYGFQKPRLRDYTLEEVQRIINSGSIIEQIKLSRNYFYKDGFYKRIIAHYATLLKYEGLLIPNPALGKKLSAPAVNKRYYSALDFMEKATLKDLFTNISLRALVDGCYYGLKLELSKDKMVILDLPADRCRTRFKDINGNDVIEFDVSYFSTITDEEYRRQALQTYPKIFEQQYNRYKNKPDYKTRWLIVPSEIGVCFPILGGIPPFLSIIPATIQYEDAVATERERDLDEIRKILVQKIPHLADGGLLFEPDEAEVFHTAAVGMMKGNKNVSVLTTYADVDAIVSKTQSESANNSLDKMLKNIYSETGASMEIFAASGSSSLPTSLKNDLAFMMMLGNRYSIFMTNVINYLYANGNISFKYVLLPISYYNDKDYIEQAFKLAGTGYSFLLPAMALGLSQRDLSNVKNLENDLLKLDEVLIPLTSAYNTAQTTNKDGEKGKVGRPALEDEEKAPKTLINEESEERTNQGGTEA